LVFSVNIRLTFAITAAALLAVGCDYRDSPPGYKEQFLPVSPETLKPYSALFKVDRFRLGVPPLPTNGMVRILTVDRANWKLEYAPPNYDVEFQFYEGSTNYPRTSRMVALKRNGEEYKWVSEQMMFTGPKLFTSDESLMNESISITCEMEQIAVTGTNIQGTLIVYDGPDDQLAKQCRFGNSLTVSQIGPILRVWGYSYDADKAPQVAPP
jgi:hypothetical protein